MEKSVQKRSSTASLRLRVHFSRAQPKRAKHIKCAELAPAVGRVRWIESGRKLRALQTLGDTRERVTLNPYVVATTKFCGRRSKSPLDHRRRPQKVPINR